MVKREVLKEFILANYEYMTTTDLAYECGVCNARISEACKELGVKPISTRQVCENYITAMYQKKTEVEIATKLQVTVKYVREIAVRLRIELMDEPTPPETISVSGILSQYKFTEPSFGHLINPRAPIKY